MRERKLGTEGLVVSKLGLGCMGMSDFYGPADENEAVATIHRALDLGVNFFDTADMYGPFTNEKLVGRALAGRRDEAIIATKFGVRRAEDGSFLGISGRPEYVRKACDGSLKRLGVDHIDLYYQHRVDPDVSIEDTVGAMSELVEAGKVLYLGLSEAGPSTLRRAHRIHPISALQTEYSLWTRDAEGDVLEATRSLDVGFVAYSPLGRGFFTGRFRKLEDLPEDDWRRRSPRFQGENFARNLQLLERVETIAEDKGVTSAQLALAWVLSRGDDIVAIPGTKRRRYLEENVEAADVLLTPGDLERINEVAPPGAAAGLRYPEESMKAIDW